MSAAPQPNFGQAWSCVTDLTSPAQMVSGFRVVAEAIARRWQTPRGGLIDDPNYGYDLSDYINDDLGPADLARIGQDAAAEAQKDDRVLNATVTLTLIGSVLLAAGVFTTAQGPFRLVLSVSLVTVTLLEVAP
jgi:phage baseplate assembly protein W